MFNDSQQHHVSESGAASGGTTILLVAGGVTALTLGVAFGLSALGVSSFWVAFPVGFGVVLPGAIAMAHNRRADERRNATDTRTEQSSTELEVLETSAGHDCFRKDGDEDRQTVLESLVWKQRLIH